jgi:hypothetical protein
MFPIDQSQKTHDLMFEDVKKRVDEFKKKEICADINIKKKCYCTLPKGHKGKHIAIGIAGQFCNEWPKSKRHP